MSCETGQGRDTAANAMHSGFCLTYLACGVAIQNSDLKAWNLYAKSVTPIKRSNTYVKPIADPYISQVDNRDKVILKRKQRILYSIDSSQYRKRFGSTMVKEIGTLTRKNQRHFRREATID